MDSVQPTRKVNTAESPNGASPFEMVALLASLMAVNALAIDIMLPALDKIAVDLNVASANDRQLVIIAYIFGFGAPQLLWGPISDRYGRRRTVFASLLGYSAMGIACAFAPSFTLLVSFRFAQGVFASGARVVSVAIVRDIYAGRKMARMMSFIMTVFMLVPITAPLLGQAILFVTDWEFLFWVLGGFGVALTLWSFFRLAETLNPADRTELNARSIMRSYLSVMRTPATVGYLLASGIVFGSLFAFVASSEQIFRDVFNMGDRFALCFAGIALSLSAANLLNSRLVERLGRRKLARTALTLFTICSSLLLMIMYFGGPVFWIFYPVFALIFSLFGLIGANFNSLAMQPLGKMAGTGSAAYGFATTTLSGFLGAIIGRAFDGTVLPLLGGFAILGLGSLVVVTALERKLYPDTLRSQ